MKRRRIRKFLLFVFGALFVAFGVLAFLGWTRGHDASHHTIGHNVTHVIAGLTVLAVAWAGGSVVHRRFCIGFGAFYMAIGALGFFSSRDSLRVIPGLIEFHLEDQWVQIGTGILFLALSLLKSKPISALYGRRAFAPT
jgi:hypothetical protein